jgi:hypothetical protein
MQSIAKWPDKGMQGIAKWPEKGMQGIAKWPEKGMQGIGKWPKSYAHGQKSYAEHSQMARKANAGRTQVARKAMQGIRLLLVGIGEMTKNIDEMAKKTDVICIWVFWSDARDGCCLASVKCSKTSMKRPKRPMQYALGCVGAMQGIHVQMASVK